MTVTLSWYMNPGSQDKFVAAGSCRAAPVPNTESVQPISAPGTGWTEPGLAKFGTKGRFTPGGQGDPALWFCAASVQSQGDIVPP